MRTVAEIVTVIVPTVGRPVLSDCLAALSEAAVRPGRVVVVDQSADGAMRRLVDDARAMGLDAVYVSSGQRGAAAARNRGLERATTRFLATIDDDCCVAPDWTERVIDRLLAHPGAVITGRVESAGSQEQPSTIISAVQAVYRQPLRDRDPLFSGNMAAERSVFERVGPFNEHPALLPAAEDNEWGYRALLAGVPIVYAPEVAVRHLDWRSADQLTPRTGATRAVRGASTGCACARVTGSSEVAPCGTWRGVSGSSFEGWDHAIGGFWRPAIPSSGTARRGSGWPSRRSHPLSAETERSRQTPLHHP